MQLNNFANIYTFCPILKEQIMHASGKGVRRLQKAIWLLAKLHAPDMFLKVPYSPPNLFSKILRQNWAATQAIFSYHKASYI